MLTAPLDSIDKSHLRALVTGGARESRSLEFKAKLVCGTESEKKEFLADVSALANAGGGDLILGIAEDNGTASDVVGLDAFDQDNDTLKIESIVRDGIAPRITGIRIRPVPLSNDRWAVVIRIPNSLNRPHMVIFKQWSRFYSRNSAGKYQLDVDELRSAFIASESVADRIRQLRLQRIDTILQKDTPVSLAGRNHICIHLLPISAFNPSFSFDFSTVQERRPTLQPIGQHGWDLRTNFDGLLFYSPTSTGEAVSYVQLFRNGVIEAVNCALLTPAEWSPQKSKFIPSHAFERDIIEALRNYMNFYKEYEIPTPLLLGLSMLNVKGFHMGISGIHYGGRPVDREHLIVPDRLAESLDTDAASFLQPCFDQIWNACGYDRSANYDETGNWRPRG